MSEIRGADSHPTPSNVIKTDCGGPSTLTCSVAGIPSGQHVVRISSPDMDDADTLDSDDRLDRLWLELLPQQESSAATVSV